MVKKQDAKPRQQPKQHPKPMGRAEGRRKSVIVVTSAAKALKRLTPSSKTIQSLLSSATLMHPEIFVESVPDAYSPRHNADDAGNQNRLKQSLDASKKDPLPLRGGFPSNDAEDTHSTEEHSQSTVSQCQQVISSNTESDYHEGSSLEQRRNESPSSNQQSSLSDQSANAYDDNGSANAVLPRNFSNDPVHIHGSQMVSRHDIGPMVELHRLVWRDDRLLRRLQRTQVSSAEDQVMMNMLADRITSTLDNVLVARINKSHCPVNIVGWLSCSIVRSKISNKPVPVDNGIRAMPWNLAIAAVLNASHNAGSITCLRGGSNPLRERNDLIEVLCKGVRRCQKQEFGDRDFINITNLVLHPHYPHGRDIAKRLVFEACHQASLLRMPLFVSCSRDYCAQLYKKECHFLELGEHASFAFDPAYKLKYLVVRPELEEPDDTNEGR